MSLGYQGPTSRDVPLNGEAGSRGLRNYEPESQPLERKSSTTGLCIRLGMKAAIDRAGAALLMAVLAPVLLGVALAVHLTTAGPVIFRQPRVGRDGVTFEFFKFRTMVLDSDARSHDLVVANEADGLLFKLRDDPRVTPVGRFLRRTALDELPQLWNVLRGDMSLVGPRPLAVPAAAFEDGERRRHEVKPGITGLWQVSGASELSWADTVAIDTHYIDHWSITLDLVILARTPVALVRGRGVY